MKTTLLVCLFCSAFFIHAQEKYNKIQKGSKYTIDEIQSAVQKANWCGYYHETANFQLKFDDGAVVYLKNKAQVLSSGKEIDTSCFQKEFINSSNVYVISAKGWLLVPKKSQSFKSLKSN
tara:strand:+ start:3708 stop:4067 length:360 start_codon:yes stop_codon:yes gene_type:complete